MGQPVAVAVVPSSTPGVVRFEANRSLTGMGHEIFRSSAEAVGPRSAAVLARQLLATGQVDSVHMFGNIVTVDLLKGFTADGLADVVRDMYQYWKPGMVPKVFDAPAEVAAPAAAVGGGDSGGGGTSRYDELIPAPLRDRSAAARAKWDATH